MATKQPSECDLHKRLGGACSSTSITMLYACSIGPYVSGRTHPLPSRPSPSSRLAAWSIFPAGFFDMFCVFPLKSTRSAAYLRLHDMIRARVPVCTQLQQPCRRSTSLIYQSTCCGCLLGTGTQLESLRGRAYDRMACACHCYEHESEH